MELTVKRRAWPTDEKMIGFSAIEHHNIMDLSLSIEGEMTIEINPDVMSREQLRKAAAKYYKETGQKITLSYQDQFNNCNTGQVFLY